MTYLTDEALVELTARERPHAQKRQLVAMGIPFHERTDGTLAVHEADARPWAAQRGTVTREEEPDYAALHG